MMITKTLEAILTIKSLKPNQVQNTTIIIKSSNPVVKRQPTKRVNSIKISLNLFLLELNTHILLVTYAKSTDKAQAIIVLKETASLNPCPHI